jgi:hypothetical protein
MKYLSIIILLIFLTACNAPEQKTEAKDLAEQLKEQVEEKPTETPATTETTEEATPEQQTQPPEPIPEATPTTQTAEAIEETIMPPQQRTKMYQFLDKFAQHVTGYQFEYKGDEYFVKGTRYKIILDHPITVKDVSFGDIKKSLYYYDTVYVERTTKNAIAYCEGHSSQVNTQCAQLELYDLAYPVAYNTYSINLPEDWLLSYLDKQPDRIDENKYYIDSRAAITITFEGEEDLELNFDPSTGLVIRADVKKGDALITRHDYNDLVSNLVRDVDVNHRSKSEIPSNEPFYR